MHNQKLDYSASGAKISTVHWAAELTNKDGQQSTTLITEISNTGRPVTHQKTSRYINPIQLTCGSVSLYI